ENAAAELVRNVQVGPAIVVGIEPDGGERGALAAGGARGNGNFVELPISSIAEEIVPILFGTPLAVQPGAGPRRCEAGEVKVKAAVPVVVGHGDSRKVVWQMQIA